MQTEFYTGVRFVVQAHYPRQEDYREETYNTRAMADAARKDHNRRGANVQILERFWQETTRSGGWYPTKTLCQHTTQTFDTATRTSICDNCGATFRF